jgi:PAS domain-containing protein
MKHGEGKPKTAAGASGAPPHADSSGEALFREMANGLPLIVWVHDAVGNQVMVNDTFCAYFGVTREAASGSG